MTSTDLSVLGILDFFIYLLSAHLYCNLVLTSVVISTFLYFSKMEYLDVILHWQEGQLCARCRLH